MATYPRSLFSSLFFQPLPTNYQFITLEYYQCGYPVCNIWQFIPSLADGALLLKKGRHRIDLSADQLGQNPTVYEKDGEWYAWAGKPNDVYCMIHSDPTYQTLCQLAGETLPCCLRENAAWRDRRGRLHRGDGPAEIWADGTQLWYWQGKQVTEEEHARLREQSEST